MARTSGLKYWCASSDAATKLTDKMANAIGSATALDASGAPQKNFQVAYKNRCTKKRTAWTIETKVGIPARTLEDERARDCAVALSSGVSDSIIRIGCASAGCDTNGNHEFLEGVLSSAGFSRRGLALQGLNPAG